MSEDTFEDSQEEDTGDSRDEGFDLLERLGQRMYRLKIENRDLHGRLQRSNKVVIVLQKEIESRAKKISELQIDSSEVWGNTEGYHFRTKVSDSLVTDDVRDILSEILPEMLQQFAAKSASYQRSNGDNVAANFGVVGQYMKMHDKVSKLERPMFEDRGMGPDLEFEPVEEVLGDLLGHVLLAALHWRRARTQKEKENTEEFSVREEHRRAVSENLTKKK